MFFPFFGDKNDDYVQLTTEDYNANEVENPTDEEFWRGIVDSDYIDKTSSESSIASEEFLYVDSSEEQSFSEGSGEDDEAIDITLKTRGCSRSFKIPEYNKIACLIEDPKSPKNAAKFCKSKAMKLLKIEDETLMQKIFEGTAKIFGTGGGTALWVDGKWNSDVDTWKSWHDKLEINKFSVSGRVGDCLRIFSPIGQKFELILD